MNDRELLEQAYGDDEYLQQHAKELRRLHAVNTELLEALSSIDVYLSDTLSGRVIPDPATYKQWLIDGIIEARNRAYAAIAKATGEKA